MRKFPTDRRPPRFPPTPPSPAAPLTLEDLEERIRRLESSGALEAATTSDGGTVINEFIINEDGSLDSGDQPFFLTDVGRIRSVESDEPTADHGRAMGRDCIVSGEDAWAEGNGATASGTEAHAEGFYTVASGEDSHAQGDGTEASGYAAHAEGETTVASGDWGSHAEGRDTLASGESSHAEGRDTTATALRSHAEGYQADATGEQSHAEGEDTTASGVGAHAQGRLTTAEGDYSHAEGYKTSAPGDHSHAEGRFAIAALKAEHAHSSNDVGQYSRFVLSLGTEDDSIVAMKHGVSLIESGTVGLAVPDDEVWMVVAEVAAKGTGATDAIAGFRIAGLVGYVTGVLTLVDAPIVDRWDTTGSATWQATIAVSGTNFEVLVQGAIAQTINWVATVHVTRVYAAELGS